MTMRLPSMILLAALALSGCGKQEAAPAPSAPAPAPAAAPAPDPAPAPEAAVAAADNELGKSTFNKVCAMCHAAGVGGAPKPGDKADWGERAAQGKETLYKHALEGFTGKKGMMPAKGGNTALGDADVKAAVEYMLSR